MSRRAQLISLPLVASALCVFIAQMLDVSAAAVLLVALGILVAAVAVFYSRMLVDSRRLIPMNQEGVALLNQGRGEQALRVFEACEARAKAAGLTSYGSLSRANQAAALVELGRPRDAHVIVQALLREPDLKRSLVASWGNFVGLVATVLWLSPEASAEDPECFLDAHESEVPPAQRAALITPRVLVLLRDDRYGEAEALLAERWREAEGVLPARRLRRLSMLWAYALHHLGRTDEARGKLISAGEGAVEENRVLREHWPELAEYLSSAQGYRQAAR